MNNPTSLLSMATMLFCAAILLAFMREPTFAWVAGFASIFFMSIGIARYVQQPKSEGPS